MNSKLLMHANFNHVLAVKIFVQYINHRQVTPQQNTIRLLYVESARHGTYRGYKGNGGSGGYALLLPAVGLRLATNNMHNWKHQREFNEQRRKVIPKLVYLHNPWKFLLTKLNLWKLRFFWDRDFHENDFIRGSKQAAIVLTNIIRTQNTSEISQFTTPIGFQQITRDMLLSRNDSRLKLVKFETEHLRRAIPIKVATRNNFGRKYCFIDMLFVGLRNTKDFDSPEEVVEVNDVLRKLDTDMGTPQEVSFVPHRIVFAEIFMRFRRDYTKNNRAGVKRAKYEDKDWSVSFYKILTFDVLNYDPKT